MAAKMLRISNCASRAFGAAIIFATNGSLCALVAHCLPSSPGGLVPAEIWHFINNNCYTKVQGTRVLIRGRVDFPLINTLAIRM